MIKNQIEIYTMSDATNLSTLAKYTLKLEIVDLKMKNTEIGILILKFAVSTLGGTTELTSTIKLWIENMKKYEHKKILLLKAIQQLTGKLLSKKNPELENTGTLSYQIELLQKKKMMKQQENSH